MELLNEISKQHNEWLKIVRTFGCEFPEDVVQDAYLRIHKYGNADKLIINGEINKLIMWTILRNVSHDTNKANRIEFISLEDVWNIQDTSEDLDKHEALSKVDKLIELESLTWHHYDKMLFDLYRKTELSMREIAEATKIHYTSIFHTLKRCKQRLQEAVGEDYQDYLNKDFELIK
jgi:DNA-directed RNA polymerase specialized sigma24 family protein